MSIFCFANCNELVSSVGVGVGMIDLEAWVTAVAAANMAEPVNIRQKQACLYK